MFRKIVFLSGVLVLSMGCSLFQTSAPPVTPGGPMPQVTGAPATLAPRRPTPTPASAATSTPNVIAPTAPPSGETPAAEATKASQPTTELPAPPAGGSLTPLTAGQPLTITQIHMADAAAGWAVGYQQLEEAHIVRTGDGGQTWQDASPPASGRLLLHPATLFPDAQSAWVTYPAEVGQTPMVWHTSDGGVSWSGAPLPAGADAELFDPSFFALDGNQVWLLVTVGAGMQHAYSDLFTSRDDGVSWEKLADPFTDGASDLMLFPHTGMAFKGAAGWVTKENGVMDGIYWAASSDGGSTWTAQTPPPPDGGSVMCSTYAPALFSPDAGVYLTVCWDYQSDTQQAYFTAVENGQTRFTPLPAVVGGMQFFSPQQGLAFGCRDYRLPDPPACQILSTGDGGQTWQHVKTVNWDGDFWFVDPQNGWAVARNGADTALVRTADGGATWQLLHPVVAAP